MNILIITSALHYLAILPFAKYNNYVLTIIISTTLSILWHLNREPYGILLYLDYTAALIWFLYDIYLGQETNNLLVVRLIILYNIIIFILNIISIYYKYYIITHTIWHILSAIKCYYVSKLIVDFNYNNII